jgi:hypothetical protein
MNKQRMDEIDCLLNECDVLIKEYDSNCILDVVEEHYPIFYDLEIEYQKYRCGWSDIYFKTWSFNVGKSITFYLIPRLIILLFMFTFMKQIGLIWMSTNRMRDRTISFQISIG